MSEEPHLQQVAEDVWAYIQPDGSWMINNMGLIVRPDGVTSVDVTSTERRTRDYLAAAAEVSAVPLRRVVLTHSHPDHCAGLSLLPDAEIIAHRNVVTELQQSHSLAPHIFTPYVRGAIDARLPTVVFDQALTLSPSDRPIEVRHPGVTAHTRGDSYVWLPEERVLFTGDLVFNGGTPFAMSGSPKRWLTVLDHLAALEPETVVPGHGPVGGSELFEPVAAYLRFVISAATHATERGWTPLEAARELDLGQFRDLLDSERIVGNLHRAMAEIEGTQPDFAAAWQDMYDYNGAPLECHA